VQPSLELAASLGTTNQARAEDMWGGEGSLPVSSFACTGGAKNFFRRVPCVVRSLVLTSEGKLTCVTAIS